MSRPTQITSPGARSFLSPVLFSPPPAGASCFDPIIHTPFSFSPDVHMVVDCSVIVTVQPTAKIATEEDKVQELLYPARHNITLPLNGLNILFNACETAFNHTTQIATDRCVFSPPPSPFHRVRTRDPVFFAQQFFSRLRRLVSSFRHRTEFQSLLRRRDAKTETR